MTLRALRSLVVVGLVWLMAGIPTSAPAQFETGPFAGFGLEAWGAGVAMIYDDPNGPIPAHPQGEMHAAYALATLSDGPSGHGVASELWPGATGATALPFIEDSFWSSFEHEWKKNSGEDPPFDRPPPLAPKQFPIAAEVFEPGGPHTHDVPPNAHSHSSKDGVYAKANTVPLSLPGIFTVDGASTTSEVTVGKVETADEREIDAARSRVVTTAADVTVTIPGGSIQIDKVTTTAMVTTDGTEPVIEGNTVVSGLTVNGQGYTLDEHGLHAGGDSQPNPILGELNAGAAQALAESGTELTFVTPIDTVADAEGSRSVGGVMLHMTAARMEDLVAALPDPIQNELRKHISTTHDFRLILGAANVRASALEAFDFGLDDVDVDLGGDDFGTTEVLGTTFDSGSFTPGDVAAPAPVTRSGGGTVTGRPAFAAPVEVDGVSVAAFLVGLAAALAAARGLKVLSDRALMVGAATRCPSDDVE